MCTNKRPFSSPLQFCSDMRLMFDNAWLYNKKTSRVYKYCTKLMEVFDSTIDAAMVKLGYCCGQRVSSHYMYLTLPTSLSLTTVSLSLSLSLSAAYFPPSSLVLLWQGTVYHSSGRSLLLLPEQVYTIYKCIIHTITNAHRAILVRVLPSLSLFTSSQVYLLSKVLHRVAGGNCNRWRRPLQHLRDFKVNIQRKEERSC